MRPAETHAQTRSRRLVHLAVDEAGLVDDARVAHLQVEVGTLAGTLAHAREHRRAAVLLGQVVDELLDDNRLAHAGAAEQTRLAALDEGLDEVDGLDAGLEDLGGGGQLVVVRSRTVDGHVALHLGHRLLVDGLAHAVPDAAPRVSGPTGHHDRVARVDDLEAADETVRRAHGHRADKVARQVRLDLEHEVQVARQGLGINRQRVVNRRQLIRGKFDVNDRADDTHDATGSALAGLELLLRKHFVQPFGPPKPLRHRRSRKSPS